MERVRSDTRGAHHLASAVSRAPMKQPIDDTPEADPPSLRQILVTQYDTLIRRLTRRLGSADLADDALHDAWIRLEREPDPAAVRDPLAYVMRVASNVATDVRLRDRRHARLLGGVGIDGHADKVVDDLPDPERVAVARSEVEALQRAINELPERRRDIALAAWTEQSTYSDLAKRYGVTVRTIQIEVKSALVYCAARIERK